VSHARGLKQDVGPPGLGVSPRGATPASARIARALQGTRGAARRWQSLLGAMDHPGRKHTETIEPPPRTSRREPTAWTATGRASCRVAAWVFVALAATPSCAGPGRSLAAAPPVREPGLACVEVWGETRPQGVGYDHVVHLSSTCVVTATCTVRTDVSQDWHEVIIRSGEHLAIVTARGDEHRTFAPEATCKPLEPAVARRGS
jgi:hypothetical protein